MDARLIVVGGKANKSEVALKLPTTIGRSRTADLTVAHPKVSRQHCQIFERDGMLVVRDNGSLNGTYIEDVKITESVLKPGEKLTVGPLTFVAAYEPARADAGEMLSVDSPTPCFDVDAFPFANPSAAEKHVAGATEGDADAWLDDSPGFSASYGEPPPDSSSWFPEPPGLPTAEPPLSFDNLAPPPPAAADADDFQLPATSELAETLPADSPADEDPPAAHPTLDLPPPTVAFESTSHAPIPLSPGDFRSTAQDSGAAASDAAEPAASIPTADAAEEVEESSWLPAVHDETAANEEPFGYSPEASEAPASPVLADTIQGTGLDKTTEMVVDTAAATTDEGADAAPSGKVGDRASGRKSWWPFGGKKKPPKLTSSDATAPLVTAEPTPPLPSESQSLHTDMLSPIVVPEDSPQPTAAGEPAADEPVAEENEAAAADDEELSQFLKSLGN